MAENNLGWRVINLLQTQTNKCIELKDICKHLKIHKKQLNVELYRLKRQGALNKIQESPPVWQLVNSTTSEVYLPLRLKHPRKKHNKEWHRGGKLDGYKHGHKFGQKKRNKMPLNKDLIQGIIHYLQNKKDPIKSVDIARAVGKSTSSEINPSLYHLHKQNVVIKVSEKPVSWIINSGLKHPHSSSLVDPTLELTNQKDVLLGQNSGSYTECDDQETLVHHSGFGTMDTLDRNLAVVNQNSPNIDIGGLNMNSPSHEVCQFEDDNQDYNFLTPSFSEQMFGEGMQLGEDNFESEDKRLTQSDDDILDSLQDSSDVTEISKDTESTTSDINISIKQNVSKLQPPISNNENVTDVERNEIDNVSVEKSQPISVQMNEDQFGLELTDIDELLKTMLNCPMQTAKLFILETKLNYPPGKVEELLKNCKENKLVKTLDQLWIMTPNGVAYIKGKLEKMGQKNDTKTYVVQPSQAVIPKTSKPTFKGPPPSPLELLQKENSVINANLPSSNTNLSHPSIIHQNHDHSSMSQVLGKPTSSNNVIHNVSQQPFPSSREPVPLMSLPLSSSSSTGGGTENSIQSQIGLSHNESRSSSDLVQVDSISQSTTIKPLMSVDTSPFSSKNVLLNNLVLPGRYPDHAQAPGRYQSPTEAPGRYPGPTEAAGRYPGPTEAPGRYPGPTEAAGRYPGPTETPGRYPCPTETAGRYPGPTDAAGRYPGTTEAPGRYPGPTEAPGRYPGPTEAPDRYLGPSLVPGSYSGPSQGPGRYPVPSNIPESYPVPKETSQLCSSSGVMETDNSTFNLLSNRHEQINQIFNKNKNVASSSSRLSFQQPSSGQDNVYSQCQTTRTNLQSMADKSVETGIVLPVGHTESEHMPAFAKTLLQSFSGPSRFPTNDKIQQRKGLGQSLVVGRLPFSSSNMQSTGTLNKTATTSSGFKPPLAPIDLIKQESNQSGNLHNTNMTSSSDIRQELAKPEQQMIQNTPVSQRNLPSPSSSTFQQQPSVSGQIQIQSELRGLPQMSSNFSSQSQMMGQSLNRFLSMPVGGNVASLRQKTIPSSLDLTSESFAAVNKNPVSALMEYAQSRHKVARIEVIKQSGPSHRPRFLMGVFIGDQQIAAVECSNKKDGRREVADKALRALIASGQYNQPSPSANKPLVPVANMTHFDKIAALSHQAFNALVAGISENFAGRKVIAALIMKCSDTDVGTAISVGSGNRCITGQQLSLEGNTVNDSHAEIITRRGFIRFLYKRLLAYDPNSSGDMFEKAPSGKLRIRNGITFHLYISTAPCGDGALFSPRDASSNSVQILNVNDRTHHPTFTSQAQGLVRTKMEGGEGTIPIEKDFVIQTFDGIQRGERLRTMSCTDKICRWNVVGMQGALLSHFLEPIYLDSLTLGLLYDHGHLARALCCRVAHGETNVDELLPTGYHLNHPWLGRVTACEPPREVQKTKALSINWCIGDERAEVTDGTLGLLYTKIEKGLFSRCSKKNLYESFKKLCQKYGCVQLLQAKNYHEAKMMASDFQTAKSAMIQKFKENGYGHWVSKPIEEELFS